MKLSHTSRAAAAARAPLLRPPLLLLTCLFLGAAALLALRPAHAALGENAASVEADRVQIRARVQRTVHPAFSVHELQLDGGARIREFVSPAGVVFGVAWHSPAIPDLRQLLGTHFEPFRTSTRRFSGGRGHLLVDNGNLVVESGGRMRAFHGRAYLLDAIPAGASTDDVQ